MSCMIRDSHGGYRPMTYAEKAAAYRAGKYKFKAPPVCTAYWEEAEWIAWTDACNGWL